MRLAQADHRPAHLTRVHQALTALSEDDQRRLGVIADWKHGPHLLTYRQTERTFGLVADALAATSPDGLPSGPLQAVCDDLLEASIPEQFKDGSRSLAVDWTDLESFSRPPPHGTSDCADPEASWGHRKNNLLRSQDELFYGYYLSAGIMMPEENGPAVPELARRATVSSCPPRPVPRLRPRADRDARPADPARRHPRRLRLRPPRRRRLGHPAAGRRRPARPGPPPPRPRPEGHPRRRDHRQREPVLPVHTPPADRIGPLARTATKTKPRTTTARPRAGPLQARPPQPDDRDGYHRVQCPAAMAKIRCPLRPASMTAGPGPARDPPAPRAPPACCAQQTITVPPDVLAKTAQKHDYPSAAWRRSYARRTGAERGFATAKDPAANTISRGWSASWA